MAHAALPLDRFTDIERPSFLSAPLRFLENIHHANQLTRDYEQLSALSDAELARRGLQRDQLVHTVYREWLER